MRGSEHLATSTSAGGRGPWRCSRSRCRVAWHQRLTNSSCDGNSHRQCGVLRALSEEPPNRLCGETGCTSNVRLAHSALLAGRIESPNDSVDGIDPAALEGVLLGELRILRPTIKVAIEFGLHVAPCVAHMLHHRRAASRSPVSCGVGARGRIDRAPATPASSGPSPICARLSAGTGPG